MAPKRPAPPPPPPVESSEETDSGSGTDVSEELFSYSPPAAAVPSPRSTAPPPQKIQQPESSDEEEEEDEDEEEEEDKANHRASSPATKNPPPPPPKREDSESDEEEEEEDKANHTASSIATKNPTLPPPKREESESDKANHAAYFSATKNPPLPPPKREESESDEEEEEEETDDEAPQPVSAPKQEAEGKPPAPLSSEDKKPTARFHRSWSKDDAVRILEALAAHRREHGTLPQPEDLEAALAGSLDNSDYGRKELTGKVSSLKSVYSRTVRRGYLPSKDHDRRIFDRAKKVWGRGDNGTLPRDFGEMCQMYPNLAEEVKVLERRQLGLFKREFGMINDEKARALDKKIKKQRVQQMKLELRRHDLTKVVTKTLMDLLE